MKVMKETYSSILLGLLALIFASCGPIIVEPSGQKTQLPQEKEVVQSTVNTATQQASNSVQTVTSDAQKVIREQQNALPPQPTTTSSVYTPSIPTSTVQNYPVAIPIPGKPGYVYNPYNNNPVFVEGIASGKTVLDPKDPNKDHKFRLP